MKFFRQFPLSFWTANGMELFERMAYYGMYNVLALYMTGSVAEGSLGFSKSAAGSMMGIYTFLLYMLPLVGGAIADRYGYKKTFIISLSTLAAAYFFLSHARSYELVFFLLLMVAVGGALFKPTLTGTISRTTNEQTSSLGFGIYYLLVNIGGFAAPFIASYLRVMSWSYVFYASALWMALMLLPAIFVYKDPVPFPQTENNTGIGKVITDAFAVMANWRFMLLIIIFSGFWFVYFQLFFTMPIYLHDHISTLPLLEAAARFTSWLHLPFAHLLESRVLEVTAGKILPGDAIPPEIMIGINSGTIILFQLVVSKLTSALKPLTSIILGVALTSVSMFLAAVFHNPWFILISIFVLALGEMSASPRFLQYVGSLAPKDKVALFLGYGFIPTGLGSLLANFIGGHLLEAVEKHQLSFSALWSVYGIAALITVLLLVIYGRCIKTIFASGTDARE